MLKVAPDGVILGAVFPPLDVTTEQFRFGFEGLAVEGAAGTEVVTVVFQRNWAGLGDPAGTARIGRYDVAAAAWTFALYELADPTSPNGGWVGLSEIAPLGGGEYALIERDNQGGPDASIKWLTAIDTNGVDFRPNGDALGLEVVGKTIVRDVLGEGDYAAIGVLPFEKLEGLAVTSDGDAFLVNDNDGIDDNSGETHVFRFDGLFDDR